MLRIQPQVECGEYQVDRSKVVQALVVPAGALRHHPGRPPLHMCTTQLLQLLNQLVLQTMTQPGGLSKAR